MRLFPATPPAGPFRPGFWRSPLRGPWLTAVLGLLLLPMLIVVAVTGFASHTAYQPALPGNAIVDPTRDLPLLDFGWPTGPAWLYAVSQGLHVTVGFVAIPLLLAKLWSVIPKLFEWPPARSVAHAVERIGLALIVGSALFLFATGVVNAQLYYPFKFNFVVAHYYAAWVFTAALVVHVAVKTPTILRALRRHGLRPARQSLARTEPEPPDEHGLVAPDPARPTISRRGLLALAGGGSLALLVATAGQSIGGPARALAFLAPRRDPPGGGPNAFQVNKTAAAAGIKAEQTGAGWRLRIGGPRPRTLSRPDLLALPQATEELPIACVEGWSTTQTWTGVRLRDLAAMAGAAGRGCTVESLQRAGVLRRATLTADQVDDERSLLALRVNGADLSRDHGYPARIIVPALPGVHNTKWVAELRFL